MAGCEQDTEGVVQGGACDELHLDLSSAGVCGESDAMTGFCHEDESFYEAANICKHHHDVAGRSGCIL